MELKKYIWLLTLLLGVVGAWGLTTDTEDSFNATSGVINASKIHDQNWSTYGLGPDEELNSVYHNYSLAITGATGEVNISWKRAQSPTANGDGDEYHAFYVWDYGASSWDLIYSSGSSGDTFYYIINITNKGLNTTNNILQTKHDLWGYRDYEEKIQYTSTQTHVYLYDANTRDNLSAGIPVTIYDSAGVPVAQATTNASGAVDMNISSLLNYKIEAGQNSGTYTHKRSYKFFFEDNGTYTLENGDNVDSLEMYLLADGAGTYITYQTIDNYYGTPVEGAHVILERDNHILESRDTDSSGYATYYLSEGTTYQILASHPDYADLVATQTPVYGTYALKMDRLTAATVKGSKVLVSIYPKERVLNTGDTQAFAADVSDPTANLSQYRLIVGYDKSMIKDDSIPCDNDTKICSAAGTSPSGSYISISPINLTDWNSGTLYAAVWWNSGGKRNWVIKEYDVKDVSAGGYPGVWDTDIETSVKSVFAGMGYGEDAISISMLILAAMIGGSLAALNQYIGGMGFVLSLGVFVGVGFLPEWTIIIAAITIIAMLVDAYRGVIE